MMFGWWLQPENIENGSITETPDLLPVALDPENFYRMGPPRLLIAKLRCFCGNYGLW